MLLGLSISALIGFLGIGGREMFLSSGYIDTLIGGIVGEIIGIGMGLMSNAVIVLNKKGK